MRINTNTDTLELTVNEVRAAEKYRKIVVKLGKHGSDEIQEKAAKVVVAMNLLDMELEKAEALPKSLAVEEPLPY